MGRLRGDWAWALTAAVLMLLLGALAAALGGVAGKPFSTYDEGESGLAGIYYLLRERGDTAVRWEGAPRTWSAHADVLVVWEPDLRSDLQRETLQSQVEDWAGPGRTVVMGGADLLLTATAHGDAPTSPRPLDPQQAVPAVLDPVTVGIRAVSMGQTATDGNRDHFYPPEVVLVAANGRPAAVRWQVGRGQVYVFADSAWLTNGRLADADNLRLALQLLGGQRVAFDEYHHGYRSGNGLGWVLAQLALAASVYLLFRGARFNAPVGLPPAAPRQAAEYAVAMGNLYRQARARPAVVTALRRQLIQQLRRLGAAAPGGPAELGRLYAARTGRPAAELEALLAALDPNRTLSDAEMTRLARQAETAQRRMEHGRDGSPGGRGPRT